MFYHYRSSALFPYVWGYAWLRWVWQKCFWVLQASKIKVCDQSLIICQPSTSTSTSSSYYQWCKQRRKWIHASSKLIELLTRDVKEFLWVDQETLITRWLSCPAIAECQWRTRKTKILWWYGFSLQIFISTPEPYTHRNINKAGQPGFNFKTMVFFSNCSFNYVAVHWVTISVWKHNLEASFHIKFSDLKPNLFKQLLQIKWNNEIMT